MHTNPAASILLVLSTWLGSVSASPLQSRKFNSVLSKVGQSIDLKFIRAQTSDVSALRKASFNGNGFATKTTGNRGETSNDSVPVHVAKDIYSVPVNVGSQDFNLLLDLGSADTWVPDAWFNCLDRYGSIEPQGYCALGNTFQRNVDPSTTILDNVHMFTTYADGDLAEGPMAQVLMTVAGDILFRQEVGLMNNVLWSYGDNYTSGILGLAYSNISQQYPGTDFTKDVNCPLNSTKYWQYYGETVECNQINYPVVVDNLASKMSSPFLTIALSRDSSNSSNGGVITFGGIGDPSDPKVNASVSNGVASVPLEPLASDDTGLKRLHIISIDGITLPAYSNLSAPSAISSSPFGSPTDFSNVRRSNKHVPRPRSDNTQFVPLTAPNGTTSRKDSQVILDTGASQIYLAPNIAKSINSLFVPAAVKHYSYGVYYLDCENLEYIPPIAFTIGGEQFPMNPVDLVKRETVQLYNYENGTTTDSEVCYSAVSDADEWDDGTGNAQNVLGTPFFKNVALVMDLSGDEGAEYALLSRPYYES